MAELHDVRNAAAEAGTLTDEHLGRSEKGRMPWFDLCDGDARSESVLFASCGSIGALGWKWGSGWRAAWKKRVTKGRRVTGGSVVELSH